MKHELIKHRDITSENVKSGAGKEAIMSIEIGEQLLNECY